MVARDFVPDPSFVPTTESELAACLQSWHWRMFSGQLYQILAKSKDTLGEEVTQIKPFIPNAAQTDFLTHLHYRNIILKARQLGMTTAIAICWLDHTLFNANQRCVIIAHTAPDAEVILRDKVKFAYSRLPDSLKAAFPIKRDAAEEILFAHNNSSIRVATSARSGTYQRVHVSEMGKIGAIAPKKAVEIVTGTLPAVPADGIVAIESTAEGQSGEFYRLATQAERLKLAGKRLTRGEYRFHFYPWFTDAGYQMDPKGVPISPTDHEYFDRIEVEMDTILTLRQRAWYIQQRDAAFSGDAEKMWQEFPSTPGECWQKSTEGMYYAPQLARARAEGRIVPHIPHVTNVLVHTFWDIGSGDGTGIWMLQHVGPQERFLRYIEGWGLPYDHFVKELRATGWLFGTHHLPHDAEHVRQQERRVAAPIEMLRELAPDWRWHTVPRVQTIQHGIEMTRLAFSRAIFDAEGCKEGLIHLGRYQKTWNERHQFWSDTPLHNEHSEAADSFRQWAQGYDPLIATPGATRRPPAHRRRGMMT